MGEPCMVLVVISILASSCNEQLPGQPQVRGADTTGISATGTILLNGNVVVIPPPSLLSHMIALESIPYDASIPLDASHPEQWTGEMKKALNLGVLGADLSYLINHGQSAAIPQYLASIRRLTDDLGISHEVDPELLQQIEFGLGDPSKMLGLQSVFFRNLEHYLKNNNRLHISTCILLGGWAESMHHLASPADSVAGHPLDRLLADQTYSAQGVKALAESIQEESFIEIRNSLFMLCEALDDLEKNYTFMEPVHDQRESITYFRSNTTVECTDEQLVYLHSLISDTRKLITAP